MLIESGSAPGGGLWLAVGIGINLISYPTGVERPATGVAEHLRHDVSRPPTPDEALAVLAEDFDSIPALWLEQGFRASPGGLDPYGRQQTVQPRLERRDGYGGVAEGLDGDGALLLRLPAGGTRRITAGDVFFPERP